MVEAYWTDKEPDFALYCGDNRIVMPQLEPESVDSIVTDPPYELGFMGKKWDRSGIAYNVELWRECLRVLKPGGHLLAFGGSRTYHRLACAIEDAGFEIRDDIDFWYDANPIFASFYDSLSDEQREMLHASAGAPHLSWIYAQGFPKSLDVSKNLRTEQFVCTCNENSKALSQHRLRSLPNPDLPSALYVEDQSREVLQSRLSEQGASELWTTRAESEITGPQQSSMEGRSNGVQEERQLHRSALRENAGIGAADGPQGRLHHGAPVDRVADVRVSSDENGSGQSSQPHTLNERRNESGTVADECRSQAWGGWPLCSRCGKPILPEGIGSALKPAHEPIVLARKPFDSTLILNVLCYGTGGLRIDDCRIPTADYWERDASRTPCAEGYGQGMFLNKSKGEMSALGRWPSNICHDGSEEVLAGFPKTDPSRASMRGTMGESPFSGIDGSGRNPESNGIRGHDDNGGSTARFFYCAKADKSDRGEGLDDLPLRSAGEVTDRKDGSDGLNSPRAGAGRTNGSRNHHPTVKPTDLMRYLCRLVTPPSGLVLDPFCGSGSTGKAARAEGFRFIGIEINEEYCALAAARCEIPQRSLWGE